MTSGLLAPPAGSGWEMRLALLLHWVGISIIQWTVLCRGTIDMFIRENPTKMDDLGVPLFQETPI